MGLATVPLLPAVEPVPTAAEQQRILAVIKEIQTQQATIAENRAKIDEKLAAVAEAIRVARIYSSRGALNMKATIILALAIGTLLLPLGLRSQTTPAMVVVPAQVAAPVDPVRVPARYSGVSRDYPEIPPRNESGERRHLESTSRRAGGAGRTAKGRRRVKDLQ